MKKFIITFCFLLACSAQAAKQPKENEERHNM
jgi:hypothetical protein